MSWDKRELTVAVRCDTPRCRERMEIPIAFQTFGLDQQRSSWLESHYWSDKLDRGVVVHLCPTHTKESKMATDKAIQESCGFFGGDGPFCTRCGVGTMDHYRSGRWENPTETPDGLIALPEIYDGQTGKKVAEPAPVTCSLCRKKRDVAGQDALDYSPAQVIFGGPLGWYSGEDGEICADCMYLTMNGRINEIVRKDQ